MVIHFFLVLGLVDWNTLDADIKFSIYWLKTWFSLLSLRFSSFTLSTLWDKSKQNTYLFHRDVNNEYLSATQLSIKVYIYIYIYIYIPSRVFCSSRTCAINLAFSSCSSGLISGSKPMININLFIVWHYNILHKAIFYAFQNHLD